MVRLEEERRRMEKGWESRWRLEDKYEARIEEVKEGEEDEEDEKKDDRELRADGVHSDETSGQSDESNAATLQNSEQAEQAKAAANTARRKQLSQLTEQYSALYTPIPPLNVPPNTSPAAVTQLHLDRSHTTEQLLAALTTRYSHSSTPAFHLLLAELQHSFLSFLITHDPSAFSYYKHLLTILSLSTTLLTTHPTHLAALLGTVRPQLSELPADWLNDPLSSDSFMLECVERLMDMVDEVGGAGVADVRWAEVREESGKVEALLHKKFGWERRREAEGVVEDDDEYAPVIVQLPPDHDEGNGTAMTA